LLKSIVTRDWDTFYEREIDERRMFTFPPFCYLLKLECRRATSASAERSARTLAQKLQNSELRLIVEGPALSFHEKIQNKYGWQLVLKAKDRNELLQVVRNLPSGWTYDIDPLNLM
jgi:primosomal protein N' (replication factor Y)